MIASSNDDSFKDLPDFLRLRALLESAQFGQQLPKALPARKLVDACDAAAAAGGPVKCDELHAAAGERPLAKALCSYIRQGWAELLTGRATVADVLNVLYVLGDVALDRRYSCARSRVRGRAVCRERPAQGLLDSTDVRDV